MTPASTKARQARNRAAGVCAFCGKRPLVTAWCCEACHQYRKEYHKAMTERNHRKGLSRRGRPLSDGWLAHFAALLLLATPALGHDAPELTRSEHVRTIETNHVHCDQTGRETFTQNLFVDYLPHRERPEIIAWRMEHKSCRPERDWQRGGWTMLWLDGDTVRRVTADTWYESWETFDVEIARRAEESRRELITLTP